MKKLESGKFDLPYIEQSKRKKILLLTDDLRMPSGVATMAREFVYGTAHHFNWVQIGGAVKHPDAGKVIDISQNIDKTIGINDSSVKIYPVNGYGDPMLLRSMIDFEHPDAILHFTDPRFWGWLYDMEYEIRKKIPLTFLSIWDAPPVPHWNQSAYESCDLIMCISKQTQILVQTAVNPKLLSKDKITYVPHGINSKIIFPMNHTIDSPNNEIIKIKNDLFGDKDYKFVILWNNRNTRRKNPGDVLLSYKSFVDRLPKKEKDQCVLLMHTKYHDDQGTDIKSLITNLLPDYNIIVNDKMITPIGMNVLYNIADVTLNIASNEGWGLSSTESMMAGKMIINNTTGGLQDQMRFEDENGKKMELTSKFISNHVGRYKKTGKWVIPVFPKIRSLQGSMQTPYIFDDKCDWVDVGDAIYKIYKMTPEERNECGLAGREYALSDESMMSAKAMSYNIAHDLNKTMENFNPRNDYEIIHVNNFKSYRNKELCIL